MILHKTCSPIPWLPPTQHKQLLVTERCAEADNEVTVLVQLGPEGCGHDKEMSVFNSDHYGCLFKRIVVRDPGDMAHVLSSTHRRKDRSYGVPEKDPYVCRLKYCTCIQFWPDDN